MSSWLVMGVASQLAMMGTLASLEVGHADRLLHASDSGPH